MWVEDSAPQISQIDLMNEARAMRDAALARHLANAWQGLTNFAARVLHVGHGHARTN